MPKDGNPLYDGSHIEIFFGLGAIQRNPCLKKGRQGALRGRGGHYPIYLMETASGVVWVAWVIIKEER